MSQLWVAANGYMATPTLSEELRHNVQPATRFRQFCDIEEAIGKNKGDVFQWNVYGDTTDEATSLDESLPMPETGFPITQASVTMLEWGIAVPYSGKFDDLSEHDVRTIIHKTLKNNARRALDTAAHAQFDATILRFSATGAATYQFTETGTAGGTNNLALGIAEIKYLSDLMQERNTPLYDGENYVCVTRPTTLRPVLDDLEDIHQYVDPGWNRIMNGEKGRYDAVRFVTQTHIASEAWTNSASDAAYFFGADTVTEALACPEEIRGKIPDDYGRGRGIAWYALLQFGINHADTTSAATKLQARIYKWDSDS